MSVPTRDAYLPERNDVCIPRGKHGYVARVDQSEGDLITFTMFVDGRDHGQLSVRLSTFLGRFELLHRP